MMTNSIIIRALRKVCGMHPGKGLTLRERDGSGSIDTLAWRCDVFMHVR